MRIPTFVVLVAALVGCHRPPAAPLVLAGHRVALPGHYMRTQATEVRSVATPWAEETAQTLGIALPALAARLGVAGARPGRTPAFLSSELHRTGDFTHVRSRAACLYQLQPLESGPPPRRWLAALVAPAAPDAQLARRATWIVALVDRDRGAVATLPLETHIPHATRGFFDLIDTTLKPRRDGTLAVVIEYSHASGGEACEQHFAFTVRAEQGPRLVLERRDYREERCVVLGTRPPPG
jgi:hypothetical protein